MLVQEDYDRERQALYLLTLMPLDDTQECRMLLSLISDLLPILNRSIENGPVKDGDG
jgi:hypothetical protein